jgi:dihydrolipoamide dehydrogenase
MSAKEYDLVVVGSGPGGYVAAIRAAQLGMKTAIVERYNTLGGTCLNVGCIPSKALLDSSEHFHNAVHHFKTHGIDISGEIVPNLAQMIRRKDDVVSKIVDGVRFLMRKNKIDVYHGHGSFDDAQTVSVALNAGGEQKLSFRHAIVATGSKPASLPNVPVDKKRIITSTEALKLSEIPGTMVVIGGGVIGLEMGSVYARLGTKVTVVEYADGVLASMDRDLGKEIQKILVKHLDFSFHLSHRVTGATAGEKSVKVTALNAGGEEVSFEADYCLVSVGRKPYTEGLRAEKAGIALDERGRVIVNDRLQTTQAHIYAVGDVVRGAMLAHKASDEGVMAVELMAGMHAHVNYLAIPNVVYTWPEVASVGYSEEEVKAQGRAYKTGKFPFAALGRARASGDVDGFVKVIADAATDEILGVHTIGPRCADVIAEAVTAMEFRASAEDLGIFSHAHPTFAEAVKEAALAASGNRALHL